MSDGYTSKWRNHIIQHPRPALIRCYVGEDCSDLDVPEDVNWARMAETIDSLDPDRIECWSGNGTLIRGMKRPEPRARGGAGIPLHPSLHGEPLAAAFSLYAQHLAEAYRFSTGVAFEKFAEVVQYQGSQAERLGAELQKAKEENERLREDMLALREEMAVAGGGDGDGDSGDLLSAAMKMGLGVADKAAPNGKGQA